MSGCMLCPRECGVDRGAGEKGFCLMGSEAMVARASLHEWEEPCISGKNGSGTVFFCGCNLRCVFCQNREISAPKRTDERWVVMDPDELAGLFLRLAGRGAENINLVTPTIYSDRIASAIKTAKAKGLSIPVVYNCGGYESVEALKRLKGLVDIWMPDLKYFSDELSMRYSNAPHYFERACSALDEMTDQTGGQNLFDDRGMMTKGIIVRHLVLPGHTSDSKHILRYLHTKYGDAVYISIMNQYTPVCGLTDHPEINRKVDEREYKAVVDFAERIGIDLGFIQEGGTAEESFIPDFDGRGLY